MKTSTIWLSYDLGVRGDYEGLYQWLDQRRAKECGDSVALLQYKHAGNVIDALKKELKASIEINKRVRVYVIYRDETTGKNKGVFVFGGRRAAAWSGYAADEKDLVDEEG